MNAINSAQLSRDAQRESAHNVSDSEVDDHHHNMLVGKLYRFHGFRVLDADGRKIGQVDWIWPNQARGRGEFIGVHLQWLRGKVRPVPACSLRIDMRTSTIHVMYTKDQIKRIRRFSIERELTAEDKRAIYVHFDLLAAAASRRLGARRVTA